jgi:hypothetical protein
VSPWGLCPWSCACFYCRSGLMTVSGLVRKAGLVLWESSLSIKVCVAILITCTVCSSGFIFWILANPLCWWKLPTILGVLTPLSPVSIEFQPMRRSWTFDLDQSSSRGRDSHSRNIRKDRLLSPLCVLCPCARAPFCRSKFCLARQFSISVSLIVTPVVFGGLNSNSPL